jgi:hypothetical protein
MSGWISARPVPTADFRARWSSPRSSLRPPGRHPRVTGGETSAAAVRNRTHRLGVHRVTHVWVAGPDVGKSAPTAYLDRSGVVEFADEPEWLLEVTFDGASGKARTIDLRPGLPLRLRY